MIQRNGLGEFAHGSSERLVAAARSLWDEREDSAVLAERCRAYVMNDHSEDVVSGVWVDALGLGTSVATSLVLNGVAED